MKLTFGHIKAETWPSRVLHLNSTDPRLLQFVNRVCERLLEGMKAKGTVSRYRVCLSESCLVLPRRLETVEAFALDCGPGVVRNGWFEFLGSGPGIQSEDSCLPNTLIQGDEVASFDNVLGTGKKLAIYNDVAETAGGYVILRFYDSNAKWVRTLDGASWIDGEKLAISETAGQYVYTTSECMPGGFVEAIKTSTNGTIRLYEYKVSNGDLKPLAYWEHDELIPQYRSILIPGLKNSAGDGDECTKRTVTIRGKARFVPVSADNDILQIQSMEAIRLACQAVQKEEKDLLDEADNYWFGRPDPRTGIRNGGAFGVLDRQLAHFQGSGASQPIQVHNRGITGPAVTNLI